MRNNALPKGVSENGMQTLDPPISSQVNEPVHHDTLLVIRPIVIENFNHCNNPFVIFLLSFFFSSDAAQAPVEATLCDQPRQSQVHATASITDRKQEARYLPGNTV